MDHRRSVDLRQPAKGASDPSYGLQHYLVISSISFSSTTSVFESVLFASIRSWGNFKATGNSYVLSWTLCSRQLWVTWVVNSLLTESSLTWVTTKILFAKGMCRLALT